MSHSATTCACSFAASVVCRLLVTCRRRPMKPIVMRSLAPRTRPVNSEVVNAAVPAEARNFRLLASIAEALLRVQLYGVAEVRRTSWARCGGFSPDANRSVVHSHGVGVLQ